MSKTTKKQHMDIIRSSKVLSNFLYFKKFSDFDGTAFIL